MVSRVVEKKIYDNYNHLCAICGKKTAFDEGEVDHIKPKSKGGTDDPKNLQWLCHTCNKIKGNKYTNSQVAELLGLKKKPKKPTSKKETYVTIDDPIMGEIKVLKEDTEIITDIFGQKVRVIKPEARITGFRWKR
jgi:hypothetical protein